MHSHIKAYFFGTLNSSEAIVLNPYMSIVLELASAYLIKIIDIVPGLLCLIMLKSSKDIWNKKYEFKWVTPEV